jgi:hypothetical protein
MALMGEFFGLYMEDEFAAGRVKTLDIYSPERRNLEDQEKLDI